MNDNELYQISELDKSDYHRDFLTTSRKIDRN